MANTLQNPANFKLLQYDQGFLSTRLIDDANNDKHLMFYADELIKSEFFNIEIGRYIIDATYKVLPVLVSGY